MSIMRAIALKASMGSNEESKKHLYNKWFLGHKAFPFPKKRSSQIAEISQYIIYVDYAGRLPEMRKRALS